MRGHGGTETSVASSVRPRLFAARRRASTVHRMQTSARNRFEDTVSAVRPGAVNDEIELALAGGQRLSAVVTRESSESLGLAVGAEAVALVKAPWIVLVTDAAGYRFSARNQFAGTLTGLERGAVNTVVEVTSGDLVIAAVVTNDSVDSLGLAEGVAATAIFKASHVILATRA